MDNFTTTTTIAMTVDEETEALKSKEGHVIAVNPFASSREPLPYDPMLGWYTAATLSGLLILFLACVGLEKVKDKILMTFEKDHTANVPRCVGDRASLAGGGCDAGQQCPSSTCRGGGSNDDPKCVAENDALLGRNCVDHNYVYLTLDRSNHVDVNQSGHVGLPMATRLLPAGGPMTRSPTGRESEGPDPVPSTVSVTSAEGGMVVEGERTTQSSFGGAVQTHNVKIEIVEVHSESPVHQMNAAVNDETNGVHESVV